MDIHRFDKNGFYVKSHRARLDPEETKVQGREVYLNPPNSYFGELPITGENEILKLEGGVVSVAPDYKGQHYYEPDGTKFLITDYGVPIPAGVLQIAPPSKYHDSHDGVNWLENTTKKAADEAESQRMEGVEAEKEASGLKQITISQAIDFIDNKIDPSSVEINPGEDTQVQLNSIQAQINDIRAQINGGKTVFKKIIPFIINGG